MLLVAALPEVQAAGMLEAALVVKFTYLRRTPETTNIKKGGDNIVGRRRTAGLRGAAYGESAHGLRAGRAAQTPLAFVARRTDVGRIVANRMLGVRRARAKRNVAWRTPR